MADVKIDSVSTSNLSGTMTNYSVSPQDTDGATEQKETEYINSNWSQQLGYYKSIPELQTAIDAKATWTVGKGIKADPYTTLTCDMIRGFGKDTFNTILENMIRTYQIGGDSFAEIIRNDDGILVNIKPLDPSTIKIIANRKGLILRYEQINKKDTKQIKKFQPDEILHFSRNRVADEIHGVSLITSVENIILARNEAMSDYKKLLHRNICPIRKWILDTDDTTKIASFKAKVESLKENFEDIFIPKGSVETEIDAVPAQATLNPLPYIQQLNQYFFQATGVPQIIVGGSQEMTEATAKIAYLAFEQTICEEQIYIEEQVGLQLGLTIELDFPASLENDTLSDKQKSETMQAATPEDTTANQPNMQVQQRGMK